MTRKLLKTKEAADVLCVSAASLEKWRQRGIGPEFQKLGPRTIRYHVDALDAYLDSSTVTAAR